MKRYARLAAVLLTIPYLFLLTSPCTADEPQRPDVYSLLNQTDEAKVLEVAALSPEAAFERLRTVDFLTDERLMHRALFNAYQDKKDQGMGIVFYRLALPQREIIDGRTVDRTPDLYVVRKFLEVFPDETVPELLRLYEGGDALVQGKVVRVSGKISSLAIRQLLLRALDNKAPSEKENPEMEGIPLRVCDDAYNQLVLRYKVKGALRMIGNGFTPDVRDYHIDLLRKSPELL